MTTVRLIIIINGATVVLKLLFSEDRVAVEKIRKAIKDAEKILKIVWEQN